MVVSHLDDSVVDALFLEVANIQKFQIFVFQPKIQLRHSKSWRVHVPLKLR